MRKVKGYFTVEAALLFPFVTGVILLVIYLLFFQYDRCLMEQSASVLAMRGCTLQTTDRKRLVGEVLVQSRNEDKFYLAWEMEEAQISVKGHIFRVVRSGNLKFPFRGLVFWNGDNSWGSEVIYENYRIDPVNFIRTYRKLKNGKESGGK